MNLGTKLYTFFYGNYVGDDEYGNKYYSNKKNVSKNNLIRKSDIIIIAAPHKA